MNKLPELNSDKSNSDPTKNLDPIQLKKSIIVVEGGDGVGKTTLAKHLEENFGFTYLRTPGETFKTIRKKIEETASNETRLLYYFSAVSYLSDQLREINSTRIVIDRYIWSTLTGYAALSGRPIKEISAELSPFLKTLVQPNLTVLLQCDEKVQVERINGRNEVKGRTDTLSVENREFKRAVSEAYLQAAEVDWLIIDNSDISVEKTTRRIFHRMEVLA